MFGMATDNVGRLFSGGGEKGSKGSKGERHASGGAGVPSRLANWLEEQQGAADTE